MLNCKQAAELMSRESEARPTLGERVSLGFHLSMCSGCRNYRRQMGFLHDACQRRPEAASIVGVDRKD